MTNFQERANFIWQVADDILRGSFKENEYGEVILPFVVLRRLDCVLSDTKKGVHETFLKFKDAKMDITPILLKASGQKFYNCSKYDIQGIVNDDKSASALNLNFENYIQGFNQEVREILDNYQIDKIKDKLARNRVFYMLLDRMTEIDLHPSKVSNHEMGYIFEELLRRFSEMSNETAGEHYTPREVIQLMVHLLFAEHKDELQGSGLIRTVYDPACGTGGMLVTAKEYIAQNINSDLDVQVFGQELNEQTYAICKSDVLIMGEEAKNIAQGSSFSEDGFSGSRFDFMLSNPPFGVSWKKEQKFIQEESNNPNGRFSVGTPRSSDGALLFLQHMISKMEPRGSRIAIVFNGSPLFTGDAGSGESEIRKWIIENDWLETIVALPNDLFYNTGIATYIWVVTNNKPAKRRGKVQLINANQKFAKMRKSLGSKRNYLTEDHIAEIERLYTAFEEGEDCKIFNNEDFGFTKVTVERPLVENGKTKTDKQGSPKPDSSLRDSEKIPLNQDIEEYFQKEVIPHVPDAWMDRSKDKVGYEINFTKYFYKYQPLRAIAEIQGDILALEEESQKLMKEIF